MSMIRSALESIARRDIPDETNLWPQIAARIERKDTLTMNPKLKLVWTIALVLLGLILATTAAYTIYHYFADPGLQAVSEAGMFTDIDATADPTVLPPLPPDAGSATMIGLEQTQNGVTARLEWVSLLDPRQIFEVSVQGLTQGMELGMPRVRYPGVTPEQYAGAIFSLNDGQPLTGRYVSYQLLRKNNEFGTPVDMHIEIPLLQRNEDGSTEIAQFTFDLQNVPVVVPNGWGGGNAYAVRANGLEMRLMHTLLTPSYTEARLCYDMPTPSQNWSIKNATIQFWDAMQQGGEQVAMQGYSQVESENGQPCADVRFPQGKTPGDQYFDILAQGLEARGAQEKVDSAWRLQMGLVDDIQVPGAPQPATTPTPEVQTNGDLTMTLLSAYADANRLAVTVQVEGHPTDSYVGANLTDAEGYDINSSYGSSPGDEPGVYILTFVPEDMSHSAAQGFSPKAPLAERRFEGKLTVTVTSMPSNRETAFHFDLNVPVYPALIVEPRQKLTANDIEMHLERLKITPSYTRLYVCYNKPTPNDWAVGASSTLKIGPDLVHSDSYMMVMDPDYNTGKGPEPDFTPSTRDRRCIKLGFPVGHHDQPETLTLTIPELEQSFPEVIPDDQVKKAQAELSAQGIEIDYVTFAGNGGGGGGPNIKKKPDGMTDQEVLRRFYAALDYYHPGPWTFTIKINP